MIDIDRVTWLGDEFPESDLLQRRDSDQRSHLGDGVWTFVVCLDPGYNQIGDDCHPKMSPHGILGVAPQGFHDDVLLDPFEEDFNVPPMSI